MRRLFALAAYTYAVLLLVLLAILEWHAESHWLFAILVFAPPQIFLLPSLFLLLPSLILREWRLCLLQIICLTVLLVGYMHLRFGNPPSHDVSAITLVTHNIGQGNRQQFIDFVAAQNPDVLLLQDAKNRAPEFARRYPDYNVSPRGEFVCLSRSLIQQSRLLDQPNSRGRPVMARFEIIFHGHPLALYSVHLPTPRDQLSRFLGARAALAMFGNEELPGGHATMAEWNRERTHLYDEAAAILEKEELPYIVAGDFNLPDHGYLYHRFGGLLTDAFARTGSGFGFTFPGGMKSAAALLGPWLRIDYIFAGHGWTPISSQPDPGSFSQHRAMSAKLRPLDEG